MSYHGDIRLGDTIDVKFTTRQFSTGAPFTLAGTPAVAAYVGNGTTEITAGITLTVDFDSRTGLNNVRVVASSGNGFAAATNVQLVITAGTVDSVSVVGEVVAEFSIESRSAVMPTTAGRTLDVSAGGEAGLDWANVGGPTTAVNLSGTTVAAVSGAVGSVTGNVGGNVVGSVGSLATQAKADVNAEADAALADYDPPTNAEMEARTLAAAAYFDPATDKVFLGDGAHGGTSATLRLGVAGAGPALHVTSGSGNAVAIASTTGRGLAVSGGTDGVLLAGNFGAGLSLSGDTGFSVTGATNGFYIQGVSGYGAVYDGGNQDLLLANSEAPSLEAVVRTAVGLGSANLDTQLGDLPTNAELAAAIATGLTTALAEGYRATGATGSVRDLLYEMLAHLGEFANSGTTKTTKKLDGSTTAKTYSYDDADAPTSITETT